MYIYDIKNYLYNRVGYKVIIDNFLKLKLHESTM